jgi:hypothetical protein
MCSETEHCSSGAGGELNYLSVFLDVAGARSSWALDFFGAQIGLGLCNWASIWALGVNRKLGPSPISLFSSFSSYTQGIIFYTLGSDLTKLPLFLYFFFSFLPCPFWSFPSSLYLQFFIFFLIVAFILFSCFCAFPAQPFISVLHLLSFSSQLFQPVFFFSSSSSLSSSLPDRFFSSFFFYFFWPLSSFFSRFFLLFFFIFFLAEGRRGAGRRRSGLGSELRDGGGGTSLGSLTVIVMLLRPWLGSMRSQGGAAVQA